MVSEMNGIASERSKLPYLGTHMTHVARMNGTNNLTGHPNLPKVLLPCAPNGLEPLEISAQLRSEPELLCKEQKPRQSGRCLVSAESHRHGPTGGISKAAV